MAAVHGTYQNGKIILDAPADWPDGTRVVVERSEDTIGIPGEEQGDDPESIARWLAWFDSLQPLILTPEDEERIRKAREEQKAFELATWDERSEKLRKMWE